jgi:hypothetical protein
VEKRNFSRGVRTRSGGQGPRESEVCFRRESHNRSERHAVASEPRATPKLEESYHRGQPRETDWGL